MGRRTWIKIYSEGWLRGSIRKETVEVRGIFTDLLALAGDSAYGDDGIIQLADEVGVTDELIKDILNISMTLWLRVKDRLSNHPDPKENRIEILPLKKGYAIRIINWKKYQSEYQRQKKYRQKTKKNHEKSEERAKSYNHGYREKEKEKEKEKEIEIEKDNNIYVSIVKIWNFLAQQEEKRNPKVMGLIANSNLVNTDENFRTIVDELLKQLNPRDIKMAIYNYHKFMCIPDSGKKSTAYCWALSKFLSNYERVFQYKDWQTVKRNWIKSTKNGERGDEGELARVINILSKRSSQKNITRALATLPEHLHPQLKMWLSKAYPVEGLYVYYKAYDKFAKLKSEGKIKKVN